MTTSFTYNDANQRVRTTLTDGSVSGVSPDPGGDRYIPKTPEPYTYDDDGNVLSDGRWDYTRDGENRLIEMETISTVPSGTEKKLEFEYDYMGRRIGKKTYDWVSSAWSLDEEWKFVYDGWNLIAEIDDSDVIQRQYMWGLDLSGSMQGAGGVGGLVKMFDAASIVHHFIGYDGNGNVTLAARGDTGTISAQYEYGPFGEKIRETGVLGDDLKFHFSTKYEDAESGFLYYGYRYYNPETGRWLNRDPIGERGGENVFGFAHNSPLNAIDTDGRKITWHPVTIIGALVGAHAYLGWQNLKPVPNPNQPVEFYPKGNGALNIVVRPCSIAVLNGHGATERPHSFFFDPSGCSGAETSFGGFTGCGSKSTNSNIPKENRIPDVPYHEDWVIHTDHDAIKGRQDSRNGALVAAKKICQTQCCSKVTIVTAEAPKNDALEDFFYHNKPKTEVYDCKTRQLTDK